MQNRTTEQVSAGFFVRLAAYLVDSLIVTAALSIVRVPLWIFSWSNSDNIIFRDWIFQYSIKDIVLYLFSVTYFILLTYYTGATLGKKLFHIEVISVEGRKLTFFEVAFRETVGRYLSALVIYVGYLMVLVTRDKQGLHDILSDTRVIYRHTKKVYVQPPVNYKTVPLPGAPQPPYGMPPNVPNMPQQQPGMPQPPYGMGQNVPNMPQQPGMPQQPQGMGQNVPNMPQQPDMPAPPDGVGQDAPQESEE